jgi:hypothetical protein
MPFTYNKLVDFVFGDLLGFTDANNLKDNTRYLAEDILGDPFSNANDILFAQDVTIGKELKGSRECLVYGSSVTASATDKYLGISDDSTTLAFGHVVTRPGSIVGAGIQIFTTAFVGSTTIAPTIRKNGSTVFTLSSLVVNANNTEFKTSGTQARGTDTFVAGDTINFFLDVTAGAGGADYDVSAYVEVIYDT